MDQLTAYKILGLEENSSQEAIREAYAALSKQYHPEEEPEKFQEIHEAYVTLTRRRQRGNIRMTYRDEQMPMSEQERFCFEESESESKPEEYDFEKVEMQRDFEKTPELAFDDALEKARQQSEEKMHELVLEATAELKVLTSPKYKNSLKAYQAFFKDKKYESIIRKADFLERLCDVLEETQLSKQIYNYIIEFYRLRGMKPSDLSNVGMRLYQVLDTKAGIKQKVHPGLYGGVAAGLIFAFRALRPIIRQYTVFATIVLCLFAVFLLVWIYKKLHERWSALFSQAMIAIGLAISQFVVLMFDAYGTAFGSIDAGNTVAAVLFMVASVWLFAVVIIGSIKVIVKAIVGLTKKK